MRKKIVAGNWKMNKTTQEALELVKELKSSIDTSETEVVFCVPAISAIPVIEALKDSEIGVGVQNMHYEASGAYTGELSASMLTSVGVKYVVLGHSERREYFGETNEDVNKKTLVALENGLIPIVCVGETLEQREDNITFEHVAIQTKIAFKNIAKEDAKKVVVAYEPIWAIGTGKTATNEQAEEVCKFIRFVLSELFDKETAEAIRIQYGGSVNEGNAKELFAKENIDGGLVGGASLKPSFASVVSPK